MKLSNSHCVVRHRSDKVPENQVWKRDNILRIQRIRKELSNKLRMCGINTVKDLQHLPNKRSEELSTSSIRKMLTSAIEISWHTDPGAYGIQLTNHRTKDNPYASLYPDNFEERLAASYAMKLFVYINDLVLYIISESQRVMLGTVHEKD